MLLRLTLLVLLLVAATAPRAEAQRALAASPTAEDPVQEDLRYCRGAFEVYDLVREWKAAGRLKLGPAESALGGFHPRRSLARGILDRLLPAAIATVPNDGLVALLTESATPRSPDNPYLQLTRDRVLPAEEGDPGAGEAAPPESYEQRLAARILGEEAAGPLMPRGVTRLALEVADGDYPLATLAAHNLLKEVTYTTRPGGSGRALVGWDPADRGSPAAAEAGDHPGYVWLERDAVERLAERLAQLREEGDPAAADRMGPWYHFYGVLFLAAVTSGAEGSAAAWAEILARYAGLGSPRDPGKEFVNRCAARLARHVALLRFPDTPDEQAPPADPPAPAG